MDKLNDIVDDVSEKIESLNGIFKIFNFASEKINILSSHIIDSVMSVINKITGLKKGAYCPTFILALHSPNITDHLAGEP